MTEAELKELISVAEARYEALTPKQKANHDNEQRRSFVRGMCPSSSDYNKWCAMVDRIIPPLGSE